MQAVQHAPFSNLKLEILSVLCAGESADNTKM
jgi:hypothetical protein